MTRLERIGRRIGESPFVIPAALALYLIVTLLIRLALPHGMRLDESQQVFLAQWLAIGYDAQPPFYNWLQKAVLLLLPNPVLGLAVLKSLILWAIFFTYHRLARIVTGDGALAAIATLALLLTPQMFWQAQRDLTHTTGTLLLTNLLFLTIAALVMRATLARYLWLGAVIGLGMLTKYNFVLTLPALAVAALASPVGRSRLLDWRIFLSAVLAVAIFAPHGFWLLAHLEIATHSSIDKMAEAADGQSRIVQIATGLLSVIGTGAAIIAPSAIIFTLLFVRSLPRLIRASDFWSRFFGIFLLAIAVELMLIVFLTTFTSVRDRWLLPFLYVMPLYLATKIRAAGLPGERALSRFIPFIACAMVFVPVALVLSVTLRKSNHYFEPYAAFARQVRQQGTADPALIVADNWNLAGNMAANFPSVPVIATDYPNLVLPFEKNPARAVVMIWRGEDRPALPSIYRDWVARELGTGAKIGPVTTVSLPYVKQQERMASPFRYVLVYPQ